MKRILTLTLLSTLYGCGGEQNVVKEVEIQKVEVPVAVCSIIERPIRPELNISKMTEKTSDENMVKSLMADMNTLVWYSKSLEYIIDNTNENCKKIIKSK